MSISIPAIAAQEVYEDQPDGSVIVRTVQAQEAEPIPFDANLAEHMDFFALQEIGHDLAELIEGDIEARQRRDKQYEEAIKRSGLTGDQDAVGGAQFPGASRAVHPVLAESCVDYSAAIMKELFPPNGPVRSKIIGDATPEKTEKAERKTRFLNWQLTEKCKEYVGELEQLETQLPLGGSQYLKVWWDSRRGRPTFEFRPIDDVILPATAGQWRTADRKTDCLRLTEMEWRSRIDSGMYIDSSAAPPQMPDDTLAQAASDKVEGVTRDGNGENADGVRLVYECYVETDIGNGDGVGPYIITIDADTKSVAAIYRNWDEADPTREALPWIVEFQFIPWRGALGIGLWNLIGGLAISATGALRALLDSAHASNTPSMLKLKGMRVSGQTTNPMPGQVIEIEGPAGMTDPDIRRLAMPMPFNQPSPVLFQLLGWITDAAKGVVSTAEEKIADASNNMPVGTAQALIEQGSRVFSAIHARQHRSQAEVLRIVHRLNAKHLTQQMVIADLGDLVVSPADFQGPMDVVPVSDPAIFSETQRFTQAQALLSMAQQDTAAGMGQMWDQRAVRKAVLDALKVPNVDAVLPPPPQPQPMDPVSAVVAMLSGTQVAADPKQDHVAHIEVVAQAMLDPLLGASPLSAGKFVPAATAYIGQHVAMLYAQLMQQQAQIITQQAQAKAQTQAMMEQQLAMQAMQAGFPPPVMPPIQPPPTPEQAAVLALPAVKQMMSDQLSGLPEVIRQGLGLVKQAHDTVSMLLPKLPPDPQTAADMAEVERRRQRDEQDFAAKEQATQAKVEMNDADNATAIHIEQMREHHSSIRDAMKPQQIPGGVREVNPNPEA